MLTASFADGLGIGGDVDANWTVIRPLATQFDGGESLFFLKDHSILVQGGAKVEVTTEKAARELLSAEGGAC
jgi:hypothetical protein